MAKIKISAKRKQWVGKRDVNLKGKPLHANAGLEIKYYKRIMRLVDVMSKETERELGKLLKGDAAKGFAMDASITSAFRIVMGRLDKKYESIFAKHGKGYAEYMAKQSLNNSKITLGASLKKLSDGLTIKTDLVTGQLNEILKASVLENTNLIKSLKDGYLGGVESDVLRSITRTDTGGLKGLQDSIHESLSDRYKRHKNKAKNIALDQTRKVYNNVNAERMKKVGVKKFEWHHSGGSQKPRQDHIDMDGKIYSFDDLPVIDKHTGETGITGQAVNCRCFMTPVISFEDGEEII